jgi:formimidoylglutamate deiminase
MYTAADRLSPEDIYDASQMAFLEMALNGITSVGEFHYLHHSPDGTPYDDPGLIAHLVIQAARDVGIRIALLRAAYFRAGYQRPPDTRQSRFIESTADAYLKHTQLLIDDLHESTQAQVAWAGVAPHSIRAVPIDHLREVASFAAERRLPVHMHVAEQPAEVSACLDETGRTPVSLLNHEGILSPRLTAVHATHLVGDEYDALAQSEALVCACPTTERNLGDGILFADELKRRDIPISLGTDSHTQIDLLEDARELECHLRLQRRERAVLSTSLSADQGEAVPGCSMSELAGYLFTCATANGAQSIGASTGKLEPGRPADFFTVDLNDPSIAGASRCDLLPLIVFSLQQRAIRDVAVNGRLIVKDGEHQAAEAIGERFRNLQKRLWQW